MEEKKITIHTKLGLIVYNFNKMVSVLPVTTFHSLGFNKDKSRGRIEKFSTSSNEYQSKISSRDSSLEKTALGNPQNPLMFTKSNLQIQSKPIKKLFKSPNSKRDNMTSTLSPYAEYGMKSFAKQLNGNDSDNSLKLAMRIFQCKNVLYSNKNCNKISNFEKYKPYLSPSKTRENEKSIIRRKDNVVCLSDQNSINSSNTALINKKTQRKRIVNLNLNLKESHQLKAINSMSSLKEVRTDFFKFKHEIPITLAKYKVYK